MATSTFVLKCQTANGLFVLKDLSGSSTVENLKRDVEKLTQISSSTMKILCGYPPRPLSIESDDTKLYDVNIRSGDTIIIEILKLKQIEAPPLAVPKGSDSFNIPPLSPLHPEKGHDPPPDDNTYISPDKNGHTGQDDNVHTARDDNGHTVPDDKDHIAQKNGSNLPDNSFVYVAKDDGFQQPGIMMRHVVPSNNSCLFTSVYFILSNGQMDLEKSYDLRKIIAAAVQNNPIKFNDAYLGMPNAEYCHWITDRDHWGGAIELAILSEHFQLEIVAVDTLSLKLHRFGENCNYRSRIFLIYDGIHYDPLIWEAEDNTQTIFSIAAMKPMEMALEIAQEAKSSRQFTDIANFTLSCEVCKEKLRGEKEASEHAKKFGHVEFGEL